LCGGTHVSRGGDIGVLKIVGEESVAAGVRRIEAVTGIGAFEHYQNQAQILRALASQLNVGEDNLLASVEKLAQMARQLEKELSEEKRKRALNQLDDLWAALIVRAYANWWIRSGRSWAPEWLLLAWPRTERWRSSPG
jgi:alanyl-tRNA synthetase